jgi:hypothetical protein
MTDLQFLSGEFLDYEVPKDKRWLFKYFKTTIQKQFLAFYIEFEDIYMFKQYTGIVVSKRALERLVIKYDILIKLKDQSKSEFELEKLWKIESGKERTLTKRIKPYN